MKTRHALRALPFFFLGPLPIFMLGVTLPWKWVYRAMLVYLVYCYVYK